jgi:hypothetical protein
MVRKAGSVAAVVPFRMSHWLFTFAANSRPGSGIEMALTTCEK